MIGDFASNRYITLLWPVGTTTLTWYVRPAGNDNNNGTSPATAFATLGRAIREIPLYGANRPTVVDVTGMTININELLQLGGGALGSIINTATATTPPSITLPSQVAIVATPTIATTLTITGSATDPATGLVTLTTSTAIAPGALDNKILIGSVAGEYGAIRDYTTGAGPNTVEVASQGTFTAPVRAYGPGASLTYGDAAQAGDGAIHLNALADWYFEWLTLAGHTKTAAITVWPHAPVNFFGCVMDGVQLMEGGSPVVFTACQIKAQSFTCNGGTPQITNSVLHDLTTVECDGSGAAGSTFVADSIIDTCPAWGGGNTNSRFQCEMRNVKVRDGSGNGIECRFGNWSIASCSVDNCSTAGIFTSNANLALNDTSGTGNGTFGLNAQYKSAVVANGASVTGTSGNVNLGAAGTISWTTDTPSTDGQQLVVVYQISA